MQVDEGAHYQKNNPNSSFVCKCFVFYCSIFPLYWQLANKEHKKTRYANFTIDEIHFNPTFRFVGTQNNRVGNWTADSENEFAMLGEDLMLL